MNGFVNEEKEKKFSTSKKSTNPLSNGKQVLKLVIGEIPSFWNLGPIDKTVFTKSKYEKEQLKLAKNKRK